MQVTVTNAILQTNIFIAIFLVLLIALIKKKDSQDISFGVNVSSELKGFSILAIVLSHIGYFLVTDTRFLFPLSICAGVSVNLFLFLSGYGLALQQVKHNLKPLEFYKKRLLKLFIPFWIVLLLFFVLDKLVLNIGYSSSFYLKSVLGIFTQAHLYEDLNSPLWYFTFILGFYLAFPFLFFPKKGILSAFALFIFSLLLVSFGLNLDPGLLSLYATHVAAFPVGVLFAALATGEKSYRLLDFIRQFICAAPYKLFRYGLAITSLLGFCYLSLHGGVGEGAIKEQYLSLIAMFLIWLFFVIKPFEFRLFKFLGDYSYEIYLLHWPILYRYGYLYRVLPATAATILYIIFILFLGFLLKKLSAKLSTKTG